MNRALLALSIATLLASATRAGDVTNDDFTDTLVIGGLTCPTAIAFLPDDRMIVCELDGTLSLVDGGVATPLAVIPSAFCAFPPGEFEMGLLGAAVDPDFTNNGYIYLYRTVGFPCETFSNTHQVVRVTMAMDDTVDLMTLTVILDGIRNDTGYHCGGGLRLGPDDKLYVSTGDTGAGDFGGGPPGSSTNPYAQLRTNLDGKILRINLDGTVPGDNPFVGQGGGIREEIFAYGFRNPWRFGFDPATGYLWVGDVGEEDLEEIDMVMPGSNHSWPQCEADRPKKCRGVGEAEPAYVYPHKGGKSHGSSVTGGAFAPDAFGFYAGYYFFGDWSSSEILALAMEPSRDAFDGRADEFVTDTNGPVDIVVGPDDAIYYVSVNSGEVRKISAPASGGDQPTFGQKLVLKDGKKKSFSLTIKDDIGLGGADDNPLVHGGSVRIMGIGFDDTYMLAAEDWKLIGRAPDRVKGFKYKAPKGVPSAVTSVTVVDGKLIKVTGKGDLLGHDLGAVDPGPVTVVFTLGTRRFCSEFGGKVKFKEDKSYVASKADAPVACP